MTIQAKDYIETAFSVEDADKINPIINKSMTENDKVIIDFTGITFFTTLFFSSALTRFIKDFGNEAYNKKLEVIGLTNVGQTAYQHSLDYAVETIEMTPEERHAKLFAIDSILDEE